MTVAFFVASLAASAQTQNATTSQPVNPFPFQTDALKQAWINANPTDYEQMGGDKVATQTTAMPEFTNSEQKEAWLAQQQAEAVLEKAIPPTVITQAEKEAWLAAHASAPAASTTPLFASEADKDAWLAAFNAGKPVFVDTGNPAADELNFNNAKQLYIQQNQAVYNYIISN